MSTRAVLRPRVRSMLADTDEADNFWTDSEINSAINDAIAALWPEIYKRSYSVIGQTNVSNYAYDLPIGVERIGRVDVEDSDGNFQEVMAWEESQVDFGATGSANHLLLRKLPRTAGMDIIVIYRGKFSPFSADDVEADYPSYMDLAVIIEASAICLEKSLSRRLEYNKFAANLNKQAASIEGLISTIRYRHDRFNALLDHHRMPPIESARQRQIGMTEGVQPAHSGRSRLGVTPTEEQE